MLRLKSPQWAFLVGFPIFLAELIPSTLSSNAGSPLADNEYRVFFSSLRPTWKATLVCQIRRSKGCQDPKILELDRYENHGQIPEGPICTDEPHMVHFETFCLFAQFRCLNRKFYIKVRGRELLYEEIDVPSPAPSLRLGMAPTEVSTPSSDARLRSNIDAILKYSFAVSGQEPVPKDQFPTPPSKPDYLKAVLVTATAQVSASAETALADTEPVKATKELTDRQLHKTIRHLIGMAFSLEQSLNAENTQAAKGRKRNLKILNIQEAISGSSSKGSLLALDKDEALVILCYAVLQDICISSAVSKAWKQMESKTFGYGDLVCDSLGRRHADLCPDCAFCSLKTEQCQGASNLKRIHCDGGTFTSYINPGILAQHQAVAPMGSADIEEYCGIETYEGLQAEYWCGRLATHGCDDFRVSLWLKKEYSSFQKGDFPDKICDSTRVQHPTYCAFKSNQCLKYNLSGEKVMRSVCRKHQTYQVLSKEEGEKEVLLWSQKFLSFAGESVSEGTQRTKGAALTKTPGRQ
ncbi:acrosin-binding protein [Rhineura floridana]|uniref:acrosin-binding protein n=1 Tax=Rhineura floridana TaxID=261503 RepID=UPI002AC85CF2|nr:acrosin-binding protein [Rhineura floridana]